MSNPLTTITENHLGSELPALLNEHADRRHTFGWTVVADADHTVAADDEAVQITAVTAPRALNLEAGSGVVAGRTLLVYVKSADVTNTVTITPDGSDTIEGAASLVVNANRKKFLLVWDDVSDWIVLYLNA